MGRSERDRGLQQEDRRLVSLSLSLSLSEDREEEGTEEACGVRLYRVEEVRAGWYSARLRWRQWRWGRLALGGDVSLVVGRLRVRWRLLD
ncbi:hypothetical protein KFK09_001766 [Dendrobium nobile]|uniref:Uncharacterized protein n=1 Tax=Dendrobium nobile TaxID=94219 RepID=A0A8T3CAG6_DENNO|nr:hypothetical protein KFK09_001766 [Dendrobium nobile]